MKKHAPLFLTLALLAAVVLFSDRAAEGARHGLSVCAATLIPSLFPFFVLSNLLSALGLADLLSGRLGNAAGRLFRVSGCGAQAFFIGITGGYPVGAAAVSDLRRQGLVSREEAERLLPLCNNSGPAFILGAAGGVFRSPRAGMLLYVTHILAALCTGLILRGGGGAGPAGQAIRGNTPSFGKALPAAVTGAVRSVLNVCAYVVLFSSLLALLTPLAELSQPWRALAAGLAELGSGISAMAGLPAAPHNLAAAAFLLGWGGLSVHCQTLGIAAEADIKCARHLAGRALCGVIAALLTFSSALLLFPQ